MSNIGSISHPIARYLADILSPLVGDTPHHVNNSADFSGKIQDLIVTPGQKVVSYNVLLHQLPVPEAVKCVKSKLLEAVDTWKERNMLTLEQIVQLLKFVLLATYFVYRGTFYKQIRGCAVGSPVSPIIANLYMGHFEREALSTFARPPEIWYRYVDNTFTKLHEYDKDNFTNHLNSRDPYIQFTIEPETDGKLPFLDACANVKEDGTTKVTIYRKPTHTDLYLNFDFNHHLEHKRSVVRTLFHWTRTVITEDQDKETEMKHLRSVLQNNNYKPWIFKTPLGTTHKHKGMAKKGGSSISVPLPYMQEVSEQLTHVFRKQGVGTYHKPVNTIRQQLVHPKNSTPM